MVAGGRTLADLAHPRRRQRDAGAVARQARLDPRHGGGSARAARRAGAGRHSAADQRPRRRGARRRSRRRAYRPGRHGGGGRAAAARAHRHHRAQRPESWPRPRPRRSSYIDYVGVGAVFATGSKDDASAPIGLDRLAPHCRSRACARARLSDLRHLRHQRRQRRRRDRGRRRRRGGDLGAVAGARSRQGGAKLARLSSTARCKRRES